MPVGVGDEASWDDRHDGLYGRFRLRMTAEAQYTAAAVRDGLLTGVSISFIPESSEWRRAPSGVYDPR